MSLLQQRMTAWYAPRRLIMLLSLAVGLGVVHTPAANSGPDDGQAAALLGQLDGVFPIGVVFASGERGITGVLRWTALGRPDGSYTRFPDSALKISMDGTAADAYYIYCLGRRLNDGVSQSRSEPATVCAPLDDVERQAALGEAYFQIPLFDFNQLDIEKSYHYSDSKGIPELREKIARYYDRFYGAKVDPDGVLISAGSKPIIFMVMQIICNPGDSVLIHEPAWLSYREQAKLVGAESKFIPFGAPVAEWPRYMDPTTRILVINNPNNPAGRVYTREELSTLYKACRQRGIYLMVDEAYSDFVVDEPFVSLASVVPDMDGAIIVNSLSKNMGMSGWRVGYAISSRPVIDALLKVNQHLITCAPTILLHYMSRYFDDVIGITLPQVREVVEKRRKVARMMDEIGLDRLAGSATFYFFVSIRDFPGTSMDFALHLLLEHGIAVVPGSAYGSSVERFVRVSIGTESLQRIRTALQTIYDLIAVEHFDPAETRGRLREMGFDEFREGH